MKQMKIDYGVLKAEARTKLANKIAARKQAIIEVRKNWKYYDNYMKEKEAKIAKEKELLDRGAVVTIMSIFRPNGTWTVDYKKIKKVYG